MTELVHSPFAPRFESFVGSLETDCLICSPYISAGPVKRLVDAAERKRIQDTLAVEIVTDISAGNLLAGSTDITALLLLTDRLLNVRISYLPRIHAKVYVAGNTFAMITSANFTDAGAFSNLEYGVTLTNRGLVRTAKTDIKRYAELGATISPKHLLDLKTRVADLRAAVQQEQISINQKAQLLSETLRSSAEDELIRIRVEGRSINAIFSETIMYLLSRQSMSTAELYSHVCQVHPDLCDDTLDRVIDGVHYGRLWKHQVRNAQQFLKKRGCIHYDSQNHIWQRAV